VSSVDFTSLLTNQFSEYEVHFTGVISSSNNDNFVLRVGESGVYQTASSYHYGVGVTTESSSSGNAGSGANSAILVSYINSVSSTAANVISGVARIFSPSTAGIYKNVITTTSQFGSGGAYLATFGGGYWGGDTNVIDSLRFYMSTGNITGTFTLYGVAGSALGATGPTGPTGPGMVLLATLTASSSASLDDTTHITAAYDQYMIELVNLVPATNADLPLLQVQVGGTFQTANYSSIISGAYAVGSGGAGSANDSATVGVILGANGSTNFNGITNTGNGLSGNVFLHKPSDTTFYKMVTGSVAWASGGAQVVDVGTLGGMYNGGTGAVTGVRFKYNAGNITSGLIRIYGIPTS